MIPSSPRTVNQSFSHKVEKIKVISENGPQSDPNFPGPSCAMSSILVHVRDIPIGTWGMLDRLAYGWCIGPGDGILCNIDLHQQRYMSLWMDTMMEGLPTMQQSTLHQGQGHSTTSENGAIWLLKPELQTSLIFYIPVAVLWQLNQIDSQGYGGIIKGHS